MSFEQNKAKYIDKFILGISPRNKGLLFHITNIDLAYWNDSIRIAGIDCETLKRFDDWYSSFTALNEYFKIIG